MVVAELSRTEFANLVGHETGLDIGEADLGVGFDELPGWDSVHLLALLGVLEAHSTRPLSLPDILAAPSLESIYGLVRG
jgi:hypothetical protein